MDEQQRGTTYDGYRQIYKALVALNIVLHDTGLGNQVDVDERDIQFSIMRCFDECMLYGKSVEGVYPDIDFESGLTQLVADYFTGVDIYERHPAMMYKYSNDCNTGKTDRWVDLFGDAQDDWLKEHPEWYREDHLP